VFKGLERTVQEPNYDRIRTLGVKSFNEIEEAADWCMDRLKLDN
jgi:hypothetical protein